VAAKVARDHSGKGKTVVLSTASPYKFCDSVLGAIGHGAPGSGVELIDKLQEVTGVAAPAPIANLKNMQPIHTSTAEKTELADAVKEFLKA